MVSTSKILTVSYGTFSCTLEGFDDSFDTMKAIAEYFRDLASDDRYFGAEPPTPDAEMLAKIAEREISRRVEASEDNGKFVLRAEDTASLPAIEGAPEVAQSSAAPAARDVAESEFFPVVEPKAEQPAPIAEDPKPIAEQPEPVVEQPDPEFVDEAIIDDPIGLREDFVAGDESNIEIEQPDDVAGSNPDQESVADKLRRIRAVASPASIPFEDDSFNEDEHAQDFLGSTVADLDAALAEDDATEVTKTQVHQETVIPDDTSFEDDDEDMLARLRATDTVEEPQIDTLSEEVVASGDSNSAPDISDDTIEELLRSHVEDVDEDESVTGEVSVVAAEEATDQDTELQNTVLTEGDEEGASTEDTLAQLMADALSEAEQPKAAEPDAQVEDSGEESDIASIDLTQTTKPETKASDADVPTPENQPVNARVVKIKRSDLEAAVAKGHIEEDGESTLSPEDEAELQRELAEVEAELAGAVAPKPDTNDVVEIEPQTAEEPEHDETNEPVAEAEPETNSKSKSKREKKSRSEKRTKKIETGDTDSQAARIFDDADTHLEEPESHERRSAIQHLRAAVAATKAEKNAGGEMQKDVDHEPYRLDLESAVRPRRARPKSSGRSERPSTGNRPAPLKLVAEQRIDKPKDPVRPRRVSRADLMGEEPTITPSADSASNFSEFADQNGARSLPDLLEAAAAYMSDVEGRPQFSRPMLMQKLKEIGENEFSREEGLRSFGQLLRQGKLQKLKGGRFTITDETEYRQAG